MRGVRFTTRAANHTATAAAVVASSIHRVCRAARSTATPMQPSTTTVGTTTIHHPCADTALPTVRASASQLPPTTCATNPAVMSWTDVVPPWCDADRGWERVTATCAATPSTAAAATGTARRTRRFSRSSGRNRAAWISLVVTAAAASATAPAVHQDRGRTASSHGAANSRYQCRFAAFPAISTGARGISAGVAPSSSRTGHDATGPAPAASRESRKTRPQTSPRTAQDRAETTRAYPSIRVTPTAASTTRRGRRCRYPS